MATSLVGALILFLPVLGGLRMGNPLVSMGVLCRMVVPWVPSLVFVSATGRLTVPPLGMLWSMSLVVLVLDRGTEPSLWAPWSLSLVLLVLDRGTGPSL